MNEEQREEQRLTALDQQRKVVERVKRWNESVKKVQEMQARWQREDLARNPNKVFLHPMV